MYKKAKKMKKIKQFSYKLHEFDLSQPGSKKLYNEKLFSPVSFVYSRVTQVLSFGRDRAWKKSLVAFLPSLENPHILDIACGPGDLSFLAAKRFSEATIIGIDLNRDMLRKAEENARTHFPELQERLRFTQGDMSSLDYEDDTFDMITGGYALRNAPDVEKTVREIARVLKPGGTAAFLDFSRSSHPVIQKVQVALLSFWGKLWGWFFHRNSEVYGYIAESLRHFPDNAAFCALLESAGFTIKVYAPRFLGLLHITVVTKSPG
jgi:demethylmenaquinone methyltransferase/2-methoxy-6-polyprenyl-1,4-benzoquinol methylase